MLYITRNIEKRIISIWEIERKMGNTKRKESGKKKKLLNDVLKNVIIEKEKNGTNLKREKLENGENKENDRNQH